jgi:hypothetical protein
MIQVVTGSGGTTRSHPPSQYTVGLYPDVGFEVIVFGLEPDAGRTLLHDLGARLHERTLTAYHGQNLPGLIKGYPVMLLDVVDSGEYLPVANQLYGQLGSVPAMQAVYPDTEYRWPWEQGSALGGLPLLGIAPR